MYILFRGYRGYLYGINGLKYGLITVTFVKNTEVTRGYHKYMRCKNEREDDNKSNIKTFKKPT